MFLKVCHLSRILIQKCCPTLLLSLCVIQSSTIFWLLYSTGKVQRGQIKKFTTTQDASAGRKWVWMSLLFNINWLTTWLSLCLTCPFVRHLPASVKDKAEILLQVEELLHIKEELSSQVNMSGIENEKRGTWLCVFVRLYPPFRTGDATTWCSGTRAL